MTAIARKITYPQTSLNFRSAGGQDIIKQFLIEFDQLLKDSGLIRSVEAGQLDLTTSISDLAMTNVFDSANSATAIFDLATTTGTPQVSYAPLIYLFDDSLQATDPVKLKFEFFYFRANKKTTLDGTEVPLFGVKITNTYKGYDQVNYQHMFVGQYTGDDAGTYNAFPQKGYLLHNGLNSLVCYEKTSGYLYLNICPGARMSSRYGTIENPVNSVVHITLSRNRNLAGSITNKNLTYIVQSSIFAANAGGINGTSTYNYVAKPNWADYTIHASGIYQSTAQLQTPFNASAYYKQGSFYTWATTAYDPVEQKLYYNPFILIGNNIMAAGSTGLIYEMEIGGVSKNYLCISQVDTGGYPYHVDQCLLVYFN